MGIIKMKIANDDLEKQKVVEDNRPQRHVTTVNSGGARHVKAQLDLRGKRYEEAMAEVDQYIDAALLANYQQVTIVHGKGTGAIRQGFKNTSKLTVKWRSTNMRQLMLVVMVQPLWHLSKVLKLKTQRLVHW